MRVLMRTSLLFIALALAACSVTGSQRHGQDTIAGYLVLRSEFQLFERIAEIDQVPGGCTSLGFPRALDREHARRFVGRRVVVTGTLVNWPADTYSMRHGSAIVVNSCWGRQVMFATDINLADSGGVRESSEH